MARSCNIAADYDAARLSLERSEPCANAAARKSGRSLQRLTVVTVAIPQAPLRFSVGVSLSLERTEASFEGHFTYSTLVCTQECLRCSEFKFLRTMSNRSSNPDVWVLHDDQERPPRQRAFFSQFASLCLLFGTACVPARNRFATHDPL